MTASRALRRRTPPRGIWEAVSWDAPAKEQAPGRTWSPWSVAIAAGVAGFLAWSAQHPWLTKTVHVAVESPVWIEVPRAMEQRLAAEPPLETVRSGPSSKTAQVSPSLPGQASDPDDRQTEPTLGVEEAATSGGLPVATGSPDAARPPQAQAPGGSPTAPGGVEGPSGLGSVPASVRPVVPVYPPRAEEMGLESTVVALVTTDTSGNVVDFRVERSGGGDFDRAVRRAVVSTRFAVPRGPDGRARAVAFRLPYEFRLP